MTATEDQILQNQDEKYQGQHTACLWAYNNQTCTMLLPGRTVYNFFSFLVLQQVLVPTNTYWVHYSPVM